MFQNIILEGKNQVKARYAENADEYPGSGVHLRSALSRLIPPPIASLWDAWRVSLDDPVVSLR